MIGRMNRYSMKTKSLLAVAVLIGLFSQQVTGANYWYRQDSGNYCSWDGAVWYWSKGSTSYLSGKPYDQFGADYLAVSTATEECPLRVTNGIPAVAQTLVIGDAAGYSPVLKVESGGSVTVKDLHIGKKANGRLLLEGGTAVVTNTCNLGEQDCSGEIVISNGIIVLTKEQGNTGANLYMGSASGGFGTIRGWGVMKNDKNAAARIMLAEGKIIGDGFGEQKELDLHTIASIRSVLDVNTGEASTVPSDTENGWYAVNKGAVLFPRTWFNATSYNGFVGAYGNTDASTNFVNSVNFVVGGTSGHCRFQGGVFAEDRDDVHADALPSNSGVVGIWKLGLFTNNDTPSPKSFATCRLTFRYDHTKTKSGDKLALLRWENSMWVKVAETVVSDGETYRISMGSRSCLTSEEYNAGTFALVRMVKGLMITVR